MSLQSNVWPDCYSCDFFMWVLYVSSSCELIMWVLSQERPSLGNLWPISLIHSMHIFAFMHIFAYTPSFAYTQIYTYMYIHTHTHTHTHAYILVACACARTCVGVCVWVCVRVCGINRAKEWVTCLIFKWNITQLYVSSIRTNNLYVFVLTYIHSVPQRRRRCDVVDISKMNKYK